MSVLVRRIAGPLSGSSSEERSIKFATGSSLVVWNDLRAGNPGRLFGWSSSRFAVGRFFSSSSNSRKEAAIAALSSGSCSSESARVALAGLTIPEAPEPSPRRGDDEPDSGPIEGSKKPPVSEVVTSRMKTAATRPGFSWTKSV